jgi:hypothetical protein
LLKAAVVTKAMPGQGKVKAQKDKKYEKAQSFF